MDGLGCLSALGKGSGNNCSNGENEGLLRQNDIFYQVLGRKMPIWQKNLGRSGTRASKTYSG